VFYQSITSKNTCPSRTEQRFFAQLLLSMKLPSLLPAIDTTLAEGNAVVVQLVSTAEAMLDRRLADLTDAEREALEIDLSPREYVLSGYPDNTYSLQSRFMSSGSHEGADLRDKDIDSTPDN